MMSYNAYNIVYKRWWKS